MKIKNHILSFILLGFLLLQISCKNSEKPPEPPIELPPITQEGKNTMGCLVNGEVYAVPSQKKQWEMQCEYYYRSFEPNLYGTFVIKSNSGKYTDEWQFVTIELKREVFDTGYYPIQYKEYIGGGLRIALYANYDGKNNRYPCPDSGAYGWLHISRLDTIAHIASGTFEFDGVNEDDKTDTVKIREGRFDAKYGY